MWKPKEKIPKTEPSRDDLERDEQFSLVGARKVALFLSVLEPETAEKLLSLLDPDVACAVADEAKRIGPVSSEKIEEIISEFLNLVGADAFGEELTDALVAQARSSVSNRDEIEKAKEPDDTESPISSLDAIDPVRLAALLADERPTTIAAASALLSPNRRKRLLALLPEDKKTLVSGIMMKSGASRTLKRLEDVLFERALDYER